MAAKASPEAFYSSSSPHPNWTYDVFLSFRGKDTRQNFTGHLYFALRDGGINTFIDDSELRRGEDISSELVRAIQESRISVIVFSRNYASSRWCLEELVKIVECRRTVRQLVLPIFYDVDPSDVRNQTGSFAESFAEHEERYLLDIDKVLRWRRALFEAANLSGWDLRNTADGHEAKFIRKIVQAISRELNSTYLFVAPYQVGMDSRVREITSLLSVGADDVRMVGIWGMGGIGKTTLAKAIYNQFFRSFEGNSFLANVRETSKQPRGQVRLQEQLLYDTLKTSKIKISSIDRGINMIKERLHNKRVLVILDDVDQMEQLNAIARSRDWFGSGSRIIITTRDEHLLKELEVDGVYTARQMNDSESLEIFSWHAFRNSYPAEDYTDLSRSVVAYSGGLPLALEVLGSFLFSRSMPEWKSALDKLRRIPHDQIQQKLRISFDALSDHTQKDIFLDISCFFIGMEKSYVVQILDGCDFFGEIGISVLIQRCLLKVDERNKLTMHDLLRDMGREIVREKYPKEPGKRSRLWLHEDAVDTLTKHEGTEEVEGLTLKMPTLSEVKFSSRAFIKMQMLRLLQLDHVLITGDYEYLSNELRWLRWHGFPLKSMPHNFYPRSLVAIDLRYSNLRQVWEDPKRLFEKMKILNLSHSHYLTQTPDFSRLPNLEKVILKDCTSLFAIHQSIGDLNHLVLVNLKDCKCLKTLPRSFYKLKSLETLILSGCSKFDNLADDLGEMESLTTFLADNTGIRQVPFTIVQLKNLKYLSLCGCTGSPSMSLPSLFWSWISPRKSPEAINLLPTSLQGLNSLQSLCLRSCNLSANAIPTDLGSLGSLLLLDLGSNSFDSLPSSLGGLSKLQSLKLDYCTKLQSIPDLPASLVALLVTNCTAMESMPNLSTLTKLRSINADHCTKLQSIPDLPANFGELFARNCTALERMPNLSKMSEMISLYLTNSHKLLEIPGLDKLSTSINTVSMEGCINLTNTFKQSILQEWTVRGYGIGILLPGNDIPAWFTYKDEGASVRFEVPRIAVQDSIWTFSLCFVYSSCDLDKILRRNSGTISVINHTKNASSTFGASPIEGNFHGDHLWQCNFSEKWEEGDEMKVCADFGPAIIIKKIGVCLQYDMVVDGNRVCYIYTSSENPAVGCLDQA